MQHKGIGPLATLNEQQGVPLSTNQLENVSPLRSLLCGTGYLRSQISGAADNGLFTLSAQKDVLPYSRVNFIGNRFVARLSRATKTF